MPLYFAYGSNMDRAAMAVRCPRSAMIGPARLARHRFFIMASGFASVRPDPARTVHGVLWDLALADVRALDRYEEVGKGLYSKLLQSFATPVGARRALVYVGNSAAEGMPHPFYIARILAAAREAGFPAAYVRDLAAYAPRGGAADADAQAKVRPRFATPFDKR